MKRTLLYPIAGVIILQLLWWLAIPDAIKQRIEWPLQDLLTRQVLQPIEHTDPRIIIIDIDEYSLTHEGRWPWSRNTIAQLLDQLKNDYQVHLIGSDIIFPDASEDQDALATSLKQADITTTLLWHPQNIIRKGQWHGNADCTHCTNLPQISGWITNIAELSAAEQAHITPEIDTDGLVRRIYPLVCHESSCIEMLALSLFRQVMQTEPQYQQDTQWLQDSTGLIRIPLNPDGSYSINWQNPAGRIAYISASDVLNQRIHEEALQGKIAIIGSTATGLHDLVPTPLAPRFPAVEIHGLLLQSLLDQHHINHAKDGDSIALVVSLLLSILLLIANQTQRLIRSLPLIVILLTGWLLWVFSQRLHGLIWPITPPIMISLITLAWLLPLALRHQTRMREHLHHQFSAYVPAAVINQLAKAPEQAIGIRPQRHYVTVMFADLRHFSRFSEQHSPEELADILKQIMDQLTDLVHQHGGTVDKYIGDAIMAFWGAPLADTHHAENALQAAQAMCHCINNFRYQQQPLPCTLSVGINSGDVIVGDLGSSIRRSYTVCGTAVNVAAHLEEMTRQTSHTILVGESTYLNVQSNRQQHLAWQPPVELKLNTHAHLLKAYPLDPFHTSR